MPSQLHDKATDLIRERPGRAVRLYSDIGGVKLPEGLALAMSYIEDGLYRSSSKNRRYLEAMVAALARPSMIRIGRENYAKGRSEGQAEGEAKAVLAVLRARGLSVSEAQRHIIEETTDIDLLLAWGRTRRHRHQHRRAAQRRLTTRPTPTWA